MAVTFNKHLIEVPDAVTLTAVTTLDPESLAAKKIMLDLINATRERLGEDLHYIYLDNPLYFNNNGKLNVRGSELLKRPTIYTHMGWVNPLDLHLDPDKYYVYNDGLFDPTHYIDYTSSDTYTPMADNFSNYVINHIYNENLNYGNAQEAKRNGVIQLAKDKQEGVVPVLTGFVPGADAMYDYNLNGYLQALAGQNRVLGTALSFTGPGFAFNTPFIFGSGYDRVSTAEDWKDYALGGTEMALSLTPWAAKAYTRLRSAISPTYALSREISNAPLDVDMLNSYREAYPTLLYNFSPYVTYDGAYPFDYLEGHLHGVEPVDVGRMLAKLGYFDKTKPSGSFRFTSTLPGGKQIEDALVETLPSNYPVLVSVNPELPLGYWGKRLGRTVADRIVRPEDVHDPPTTSEVLVVGNVSPQGNVSINTVKPNSEKHPSNLGPIYTNLLSGNPADDAVAKLNESRLYWDTHGLIDLDARPVRTNPYEKNSGNRVPYNYPNYNYPSHTVTADALWQSGKQQAVDYITSDLYKERLMNNGRMTEQLADLYIELQLKNLDNVELVNLGEFKVGNPLGYTIGWSVGGLSGPSIYDGIKRTSDWLPEGWSEQKYLEFILPYDHQVTAYNKAKLGKTQVGLAEGTRVKSSKAPFEEATHATTRGGIDPALKRVILDPNAKLVENLKGTSTDMLNPVETRTAGMELDRAWDAARPYLLEFYGNLPEEVLKERFFYDYLKASKDLGGRFYEFMNLKAPGWVKKYSVENDYITNRFANGITIDKAAYLFWRDFVQNDWTPTDINNEYSIT